MMKRRSTPINKASIVLPVIVMFVILATSQGHYSSGAGIYSAVALQPTLPMYRSSSAGIFGFSFIASPVHAVIPTGGGIGSVSFGGYSSPVRAVIPSGGGVGSVSLGGGPNPVQPNIPSSSSFGSIRLSGATHPIAPTYGSTSLIKFGYRARYTTPVIYDYIYTTPSRTLFRTDIGYTYSNLRALYP